MDPISTNAEVQSTPAFVRLLVAHQADLLRFILPLVGRMEDAEDVLQETASALWKKFGSYDENQPFLPWARQFARYEVLMFHRRRQSFTFLTEELIDDLAARTESQDETVQVHRQVALQACLAKLPEADRQLFAVRYAQPGMTVQKMALSSGQTANVLYKALARIRRNLFECVAKSLGTDLATEGGT